MPRRANLCTLSILSVDSVTQGGPAATDCVAVCVVRCIDGTARTGMVFHRVAPGMRTRTDVTPLTLAAIEWYGKQVDQLDTVHSAKVTLAGAGAGANALAAWDVLASAPDTASLTHESGNDEAPRPAEAEALSSR
ncbi:hypothetical protein [Streptomyces finlayi]|uniref:hypothetical protein n=1 Tax=Streptomyces finlayi TaxID=67296 RepID=UPI001625A437|nr:hypothetical protein [Streptomyces finlayi]